MTSAARLNPRIDRTEARLFRGRCRSGQHVGPTGGYAFGFVQANLVIVPEMHAYDFLLFCQRNPKPCPLLEVTDLGDPEPRYSAPGCDLRSDLPRYELFRHGKFLGTSTDIMDEWRENFVAFLLGCSFTFESALLQAGLGVRHLEERNAEGRMKNVPMYTTNIPCRPAGIFHGPMVVSMRPYTPGDALRAAQITARFPGVHGAPVHIGDPAAIGIHDLAKPDYGEAVTLQPGEVPVFWACGVTPQAVLKESRPAFVITHAPGHMLVTDLRDEELAVG
ncbi:MAG: putative hydro-lyase [Planctomycetia bacterium]